MIAKRTRAAWASQPGPRSGVDLLGSTLDHIGLLT
jgi:hypothetical protein